MIDVYVIQKSSGNKEIKEFTSMGHASYDKISNATVCASISTATILTANAIKFLGLGELIELETREGYFRLKPKVYNKTIDALLKNLKYSVEDESRQFPLYINIIVIPYKKNKSSKVED